MIVTITIFNMLSWFTIDITITITSITTITIAIITTTLW